ncbi:hypothetical protein GCM10027416_05260 [Okibacterium endophyticum]
MNQSERPPQPSSVAHQANLSPDGRGPANDGATILMATHEMAFARDVADQVVLLDQGVVVEQGSPEVLFTAAREPRAREFLVRFTGTL